MASRFCAFPRAKQELPRHTTKSTVGRSAAMTALLKLKQRRGSSEEAGIDLHSASVAPTAPGETMQRTNLSAQALVAVSGAFFNACFRWIDLVERAVLDRREI